MVPLPHLRLPHSLEKSGQPLINSYQLSEKIGQLKLKIITT
jgi:hypothetical protein